jgi:hypothetical protein
MRGDRRGRGNGLAITARLLAVVTRSWWWAMVSVRLARLPGIQMMAAHPAGG